MHKMIYATMQCRRGESGTIHAMSQYNSNREMEEREEREEREETPSECNDC